MALVCAINSLHRKLNFQAGRLRYRHHIKMRSEQFSLQQIEKQKKDMWILFQQGIESIQVIIKIYPLSFGRHCDFEFDFVSIKKQLLATPIICY